MNNFPIKKYSGDIESFIKSSGDYLDKIPTEYFIEENFVDKTMSKEFLEKLFKYAIRYGVSVAGDEGRYHCVQDKYADLKQFTLQKSFVYSLEDKLIKLLKTKGIPNFRDEYHDPVISILATIKEGCDAQYLHSDFPKNKIGFIIHLK